MPSSSQIRFLFVCCVTALLCGCASEGPSPDGKTVLLETEPADAQGVTDTKNNLMIFGIPVEGASVLVGRVGGGQNETWDPNQAAFLIRDLDLKAESSEHDGNHDNCKFCQAEKARELEAMALVRVVDADGNVFPTDARQLLNLKEDQVVVAQGEASLEDETLIFNATHIHIRP